MWLYGLGFVAGGMLLAGGGSWLKFRAGNSAPAWEVAWYDLLVNLGIGFVSLAVFGYLLNMKDWTEYFRARLAEIVQGDEHLAKLKHEELYRLQAALLKRYYNNPSIDAADSFLHFLRDRVQRYIATPFREDYDYHITFRDAGDGAVEITEFIVYYCRSVGQEILSEISWEADNELLARTHELELQLLIPAQYEQRCKDHEIPRQRTFTREVLEQSHRTPDGRRICVPLDEFIWADGLKVSFRHRYRDVVSSPFSYRWRHPIRNLAMTVDYPPRFDLQHDVFGVDDGDISSSAFADRLYLRIDSWVPPRSGFYFTLQSPSAERS